MIAMTAHRIRWAGGRGWRQAYEKIVPAATTELVGLMLGLVRDSLAQEAVQAIKAGDVRRAMGLRADIEAIIVYLGMVDMSERCPTQVRDAARLALVGVRGAEEQAAVVDALAASRGLRLGS